MKVRLQLVVVDGRVHVVKGNIDKIAAYDVHISHGFGQQRFDSFEGPVDVGDIDHSHRCNLSSLCKIGIGKLNFLSQQH